VHVEEAGNNTVGTVIEGKPCRHADRHQRWDRLPRTALLEQWARLASPRAVPATGSHNVGGLSRLLARPLLAMGGALYSVPWMQAFPAHVIFFPLIGLDGGDPFFIY